MMKKFALLLLVFLLCCGAALADMPEEARAYVELNYPGYQLEDYLTVEGTSMGDHGLMLIRHAGKRILLCFRPFDGKWMCWLDTPGAVPQDEHPARLGSYPADMSLTRLWDPDEKNNYLSDGLNFYAYTSDGEMSIQAVGYHWQEDGFQLMGYQWDAGQYVDVMDDQLIFYNIGSGMSGWAVREIETDLVGVEFDRLPHTPEDVQRARNEIIPYSTLEVMHDYDNTFEAGLRFPVYMGPGKGYGRSGNGKAVVSTNDWIEVFGSWGDWLFIHYSIDGDRCRFGWITADALLEDVPAAPLREFMWFQVDEDCTLTDDPRGRQGALCQVPAGAEVERLAYLGEDWCYVRYEHAGQTWWGFIPSRVVTTHLGNG